MRKRIISAAAVALMTLGFSALVRADVGPSTYRTIDVTGDPSQFDGITAAATNTADANATVDPISLQICNDSSKLYLKITYATSANPNAAAGLFLAIDSDNNPSTGYSVYGNSNIGSNTGFENDFPFTQASGSSGASNPFNTGGTVASASSSASGTNIYQASPYNTATLYQMIALPLDLTQVDTGPGGYSGLVFPQGTPFTLDVYTSPSDGTTQNPDDAIVLGTATYTLATAVDAPEPASLGLVAFGSLMLVRRRRRA